jgi:hypothetical protein
MAQQPVLPKKTYTTEDEQQSDVPGSPVSKQGRKKIDHFDSGCLSPDLGNEKIEVTQFNRLKQQLKKRKDQVQKLIDNKQLQRLMWIKTLLYRIGVWLVASLLILIGHFHLSLFILASFSLFFKELVQLSRVL